MTARRFNHVLYSFPRAALFTTLEFQLQQSERERENKEVLRGGSLTIFWLVLRTGSLLSCARYQDFRKTNNSFVWAYFTVKSPLFPFPFKDLTRGRTTINSRCQHLMRNLHCKPRRRVT